MKKKGIQIFFAIAVSLFAFFLIATIILGTVGVVRPIGLSLNENISSTYSSTAEGRLYVGGEQGLVETIDGESGSTLWSVNLNSRVMAISSDYGLVAVATEDKNLHLLSAETGEIVQEPVSTNYILSNIIVTQDSVLAAGSVRVDRNKIYRFDHSLNLLDLTPNEDHNPQGEYESDQLYQERINALILDYPVTRMEYDENTKEIIVVSAYGILSKYDLEGQQTANVGSNFTPVDSSYSSADGLLYVADNEGGLIIYDNTLKQVAERRYNKRSIGGALNGADGSFMLVSIYGDIYSIGADGTENYHTYLGKKLVGTEVCGGNSVVVRTEGNELLFYPLARISGYNLFRNLFISAIVLTVVSACVFGFSVFGMIKPNQFCVAVHKMCNVGKSMLRSKWSYILLLPSLLIAVLFAYYPAIEGFLLAFYDVEVGGVNTFTGWNNFRELMGKTQFWNGMSNMLIFLVTDIIKGIIPAFIFGELIIAMRSTKMQYWTRVLLYLPGIIPGVATILIWTEGIYGMQGVLNSLFGTSVEWLGDGYAMGSLVFYGFPWIGSYIIIYGALIGTPPSLYEAAKLDGCGWWRRLVSIDLPLISPQLKYLFVTCFISSVQDFQRVYMTTEGAHGTYTPMLELYYNISRFNNLGVAAAMGLVLFLILMVATLLNLKIKTVDDIYD